MPDTSREGLVWDDSGLDLEPKWQREPSVDAICKVCWQTLQVESQDVKVSFLAAGGFNKIYLVETAQHGKLIMRVSLPVDPHHKTAGEVDTLRWLLRTTTLPVPEVIAFDDSRDNPIGFEWIILKLMPGTSVYYRWRTMPMDTKQSLVEQVADFQAQLLKHTFRGIGTLTRNPAEPPNSTDLSPQPVRFVCRSFFWGDRYDYDVQRGPFRSSHDWLSAYLSLIERDQNKAIEEAEDEEDREDAAQILRVTRRLEAMLTRIFPSVQHPPERTALWHDDLSLQNIMVDDDNKMSAIIDWEFVSAMPLWATTQMPQLLVGPTRDEKPVREEYADETPEEAEASRQDMGGDGLDNEGKNELYWIHLMEYEQTQLRNVYEQRMRQSWPSWDEDVADGALKVDFLGAVDRCADGWNLRGVKQWIGAIEGGEFPRLDDVLHPKPVQVGS
jgi:hypothetical protein